MASPAAKHAWPGAKTQPLRRCAVVRAAAGLASALQTHLTMSALTSEGSTHHVVDWHAWKRPGLAVLVVVIVAAIAAA